MRAVADEDARSTGGISRVYRNAEGHGPGGDEKGVRMVWTASGRNHQAEVRAVAKRRRDHERRPSGRSGEGGSEGGRSDREAVRNTEGADPSVLHGNGCEWVRRAEDRRRLR